MLQRSLVLIAVVAVLSFGVLALTCRRDMAAARERIAGRGQVIGSPFGTLQIFRHAEYAVAKIPGARLLAFEHGGHLLLGIEHEAIRAEIRRHLAASVKL